MSKLHHYWKELQRRHVVKAGIAYLVAAWLITQVIATISQMFKMSEDIGQIAVIVLAVGFPIWLIIAWVYDFSADGIKKTEDVPYDPKVSAKKNLQLNRLIIGGLSIALILLIVNQFRLSNQLDEKQSLASMLPDFTSSIAVLAFDDMSPDKDQEYFSDGISEEILNRLAKYKDLKVISRTSSFAYKGKDVTIDIIGKELDVVYILEGSVRKSGDTFRTTVQLIDSRDGSHVWSDNFDRKVEDALFVQDEIAQIVANRLQLTLLNEDVRLRKVDPEAYELFLRVKDYFHIKNNDSTLVIADSLIRLSLEIDSGYAPAWNYLSGLTFHRSFYYGQLDQQQAISIGMKAAKKAFDIDSSSVVALNWISNWQWHNSEGTKSLKSLEKLLMNNPNSADAFHYATHAYTRLGMPQKALIYAYRAIELSPNNRELRKWAWQLERYEENYTKSSAKYKDHIDLRKSQIGEDPYLDELALYHHYDSGDLDKALQVLEENDDEYWGMWTEIIIWLREGDTAKADKLIDQMESLNEEKILESQRNIVHHYFFMAILYAGKGDADTAFGYLNQAYEGYLLLRTEELWLYPEFKKLHKDPRWKQLMERLSKDFNYDYTPQID